MNNEFYTPSPAPGIRAGITPKMKKRPRAGQFGGPGVTNPNDRRSEDLRATKKKQQASDAKRHKKSNKKRRKKNLKTKEQREDERERLTAELARLDQEDARQEKLRKEREVKRKELREQLRNSTDDDVVMRDPLSPHQLSTAKCKVVDYITSEIPFIHTTAHVVQLWNYNAEHNVAPRGGCSRSADSAAVKAALVDKTIVDTNGACTTRTTNKKILFIFFVFFPIYTFGKSKKIFLGQIGVPLKYFSPIYIPSTCNFIYTFTPLRIITLYIRYA